MFRKTKKERNYNIDFLRGIATIAIIVIHTSFKSGAMYLPYWFMSISLLLDVPVFMFISGISYSYVESVIKNLKGIIRQWDKWIYFLILYTLILYFVFKTGCSWENLIHWLFYDFPTLNPLKVVNESMWFMPMYIKVTILCSLIIYLYKQKEKDLDNFKYIIIIFLILSGIVTADPTLIFIDSYTLIYSFIFMLGYYLSSNKLSTKKFIIFELLFITGTIIAFYLLGYDITTIQAIKFPPQITYILVSLPSIILFWYLKDKLKIKKNNPLVYVGKNAIFFYFAQGISSSLLYYVYNWIHISNIYLKYSVLLIINIISAMIIGIMLNESYTFIKKTIDNKLKKTN